MTEAAKTSIFVGLGVLTAVLAFAASREPAEPTLGDEKTFTRIENAEDVASLRIVKFNDTTGKVEQFEVALEGDHFVIPSHFGYPADAQQQLLDAAGSVMDIAILNVLENDRALHDERGLIDPLDSGVGRDTEADTVGMRVTMADSENKALADFIIGHEVETGQNVRFVRRAGQDRVYTVELSTANLTTDFETWIEKDLLRLDPLDVRGVMLQDYSITYDRGPLGIQMATGIDQRGVVKLAYDPQELKWNIERLFLFDEERGTPVEMELASNEELDSTKLNGLKNALDDLKIVDVRKKPDGLTVEDGALKIDRSARADLAARGFEIMRGALISDQGEVTVDMANGVRYVLRFGRIAGSEEKAAEGEAVGGEVAETAGQEIHRYLWVMTEENLGIFPQPALKPVPELPEAPATVEKVEPGEDEAEAATADERKKEFERLKAEREKVLQDNERKKSEYVAKITAAKEAVARLNRRFDDWYYVIADDTYKQIHLGRDDIIKMKEVAADASANGAAGGAAAGAAPGADGSWLKKGLNFGKDKLKGLIPEGAEPPADLAKPAGGLTPAGDGAEPAPAEEKPAEETPAEEAPAEAAPTEDTSAEDAAAPPAEGVPAEEAAAEPASEEKTTAEDS